MFRTNLISVKSRAINKIPLTSVVHLAGRDLRGLGPGGRAPGHASPVATAVLLDGRGVHGVSAPEPGRRVPGPVVVVQPRRRGGWA